SSSLCPSPFNCYILRDTFPFFTLIYFLLSFFHSSFLLLLCFPSFTLLPFFFPSSTLLSFLLSFFHSSFLSSFLLSLFFLFIFLSSTFAFHALVFPSGNAFSSYYYSLYRTSALNS